MTGYQSKKAAALDEEGFYTIHPKDDDIQVYQRPWVGLTEEEIQVVAKQARSKDHAVTLTNKLLKEKNNG